MLDSINESCRVRARLKDPKVDTSRDESHPSSPRVMTGDFGRLSKQNQARELGRLLIPRVRGVQKPMPSQARKDATRMENECKAYEKQDMDRRRRTNVWTQHDQDVWDDRRRTVDEAWDAANALSLDAGRIATDQDGNMVEVQHESIVERAVRLYLESTDYPWNEITGWKKESIFLLKGQMGKRKWTGQQLPAAKHRR